MHDVNRRIETIQTISDLMTKLLEEVKAESHHLVEEIVGSADKLDELWKQEYKNANGRQDILHKILDSNMKNMDQLEQQKKLLEQEKLLLEKKIKELEANVVSSSSSN